jgi:hypothetical protein
VRQKVEGSMTTNLKADVRARMGTSGEKYTQARRAVLAERDGTHTRSRPVERVVVHTTNNGWEFAEANCEAMTKKRRQCRNPFVYGQFWSGGGPEQLLPDGPETRMLAQRRCPVHVDHERPVEVTLVMDDVVPNRFLGPYPNPVWQDPRSLQLIREATEGQPRTDALASYLALTEHETDSSLTSVAERAGLPAVRADEAMAVLERLGLFREGTLVG